jgi:hypothetical protein
MADYYVLIARAVAKLPHPTEAARHAIYDDERRALLAQLGSHAPPLTEQEAGRERQSLEEAIRLVELGTARSDGSPIPDAGSPTEIRTEFSDPRSRTTLLQLMLAALLAVSFAMLLSDIAQYQLVQSPYTPAEASSNDDRQSIVAVIFLVSVITTIIVFGRWIYLANRNSRALGATGMEFTPGWAVGWYFVPIFTLWKPFQAMREIWKTSKNPLQWQSERTNPILGWWWFAWIISNMLGQVSFRMTMRADDVATLSAATTVGIVEDISFIFLTCLALTLVTRISRMQIERYRDP